MPQYAFKSAAYAPKGNSESTGTPRQPVCMMRVSLGTCRASQQQYAMLTCIKAAGCTALPFLRWTVGATPEAGRVSSLVSDCVCMSMLHSNQAHCYAQPSLRLSPPAGNAVLSNAARCCHRYRCDSTRAGVVPESVQASGNCSACRWGNVLMYCQGTAGHRATEGGFRSPRHTSRLPSKHEWHRK